MVKSPQLLRFKIVREGGGVVPMSDVSFDNYPSCLSWQVLKIHDLSFLFNSVLYFPHNYHMVKE